MAGSIRGVLLALVMLATDTASADAFGGRQSVRPMTVMMYAPAPVWCCCVPMVASPAVALPMTHVPPTYVPPMPRAPALAKPIPAPPSRSSTEPPLNTDRAPAPGSPRPPTIIESRWHDGAERKPAGDLGSARCKVGFWNITGSDVTLTIDGRARVLPKDRAVTLELERSFVWYIAGREPQAERVPEDQQVHEVILRP